MYIKQLFKRFQALFFITVHLPNRMHSNALMLNYALWSTEYSKITEHKNEYEL